MPYYCCRSCGVTSYSAAGYSTVGECPHCFEPLNRAANGLLPEPGLTRRLPARAHAVADARRAVAALALPESARTELTLVVSELVTNSIRHGGPTATNGAARDDLIDLFVTYTDQEISVAVHDEGHGFAAHLAPFRRAKGGLGLLVIDALSKEWGVDAGNGDGCTVWCTLETQAAA